MMDLGKVRTDQQLEEEGAWVNVDNETQIKVRSTTSRKFQEIMRKKFGNLAELVDVVGAKNISPEQQEEMQYEMSCAVLIDWKGLKDEGKDLDFSEEAARESLKIPRWRQVVLGHARSIDTFKKNALEADAKNSSPASVGP